MPFYEIDIYVRTGQAWRNALSTAVDKDFLSLRLGSWAFKAMVLGIPGDRKDCPKRRTFIRTYGPVAWKQSCDVIVRWNGNRFTYQALAPN